MADVVTIEAGECGMAKRAKRAQTSLQRGQLVRIFRSEGKLSRATVKALFGWNERKLRSVLGAYGLEKDAKRIAARDVGYWLLAYRHEEVEAVLGPRKDKVLPALLHLAPLILRVPQFVLYLLAYHAQKEGESVSSYVANLVNEDADDLSVLEPHVPGITAAAVFPRRHDDDE